MIRILFVCHGNICRSPMAELVFNRMCQERGLSDKFYAESRAASSEEIVCGRGNPVYPAAKRELLRHGIDAGDKRAQKLVRSEYLEYDLIIGMDKNNLRLMDIILGYDKLGKVSRLLDHTDRPGDVADPWYTGDFSGAYADIERGCIGLLEELTRPGREEALIRVREQLPRM